MHQRLARKRYVRWRNAIFAIFLVSGLGVATWAARLPTIKASLGISNTEVGLMLLSIGLSSLIGLSTSAPLTIRLGTRRAMLILMLGLAVGLVLIGLGATLFLSYPLVIAGLAVFGASNGCLDVTMNVEAAAVEQAAERTLLPLFHAFFSFGTVLGAAAGWLSAALHVSVLTHAGATALLAALVAVVSTAQIPRREAAQGSSSAKPRRREQLRAALDAWKEPRTYALGVVMLGMAFAEGGANDWLALAVAEEHGGGASLGAAGLTVFSVCMTAARVLGGPLVDRFGRVAVLRLLAIAAASGLLLFIFAPSLPLAFVGAALWGLGASLGFPLGTSAAADDPEKAAARVSATSAIGYIAFLGGPPLLGLVSEHVGLLNTLLLLVALVAASGFASSAARPPADAKTSAG